MTGTTTIETTVNPAFLPKRKLRPDFVAAHSKPKPLSPPEDRLCRVLLDPREVVNNGKGRLAHEATDETLDQVARHLFKLLAKAAAGRVTPGRFDLEVSKLVGWACRKERLSIFARLKCLRDRDSATPKRRMASERLRSKFPAPRAC